VLNKKLLFCLCFFTGISYSQWSQDRFIIGTWIDPNMTGTTTTDNSSLEKYVSAHFNLLTGSGNNYSQNFNTAGAGQVSNQYMINRVATVNNNHGSTVLRICVRDNSLPGNIASYTGLTNANAAALYGYGVIHEPTMAELNTGLNTVSQIISSDRNRFTFDCLATIWRCWDGNFGTSWNAFDNYVTTYINNTSTRVAAFDYYVLFDIGNDGTLDYSWLGADRITYFRTLNLFATRAGTASKPYWGVAEACEYMMRWYTNGVWDRDDYHGVPTDPILRYNAFTHICYGSKGIIWFNYERPAARCPANPTRTCEDYRTGAANTDATVYSRVSQINLEMQNMSPILMQLNWNTTVHGVEHDPLSNEADLPTISSSTPVLAQFNLDPQVAIGVHTHRTDGNPYLTILNKNINLSKANVPIVVKGICQAYLFNKSNSTWSNAGVSINFANNTTTFRVNLAAGDMALVSVNPWVLKPIYQYWNPSITDHYYPECWKGNNNGVGWQFECVWGAMYNVQRDGTVPLYQYWNPTLNSHFYTTTWQGNDNGHGWRYDYIVGYVFNSNTAGTTPLYCYWNSGLSDWWYTTSWQGTNNGGWVYQGVACYVIPNS
jgi:hypothetical protein